VGVNQVPGVTYQPRVYRKSAESPDLVGFAVVVGETDLYIQAKARLTDEALDSIRQARTQIERHIQRYPEFATSLRPLLEPSDCPALLREMYRAGRQAGTGPMAAVAGTVAAYVGQQLLGKSGQVIVENGGDIFLATEVARIVAIEAGSSQLSGRIGVVIPGGMRLGVCTSSGTVGHSVSSGQADAAVVIAPDTALADAVATATANRIRGPQDCQQAVTWATQLSGISGALAICGDQMAVGGEVEIVPIARNRRTLTQAPSDELLLDREAADRIE